jgi:hypothetical protein
VRYTEQRALERNSMPHAEPLKVGEVLEQAQGPGCGGDTPRGTLYVVVAIYFWPISEMPLSGKPHYCIEAAEGEGVHRWSVGEDVEGYRRTGRRVALHRHLRDCECGECPAGSTIAKYITIAEHLRLTNQQLRPVPEPSAYP